MRNGDYHPTRIAAQQDAARALLSSKLNARVENTVGMATMHGKGTSLLVSATNNQPKLVSALHNLQPSHGGGGDVVNALQTAYLALKYRKTTGGTMRIVLFLGSPITGAEAPVLKKLGETLKKGSVRVAANPPFPPPLPPSCCPPHPPPPPSCPLPPPPFPRRSP